MDEIARSAAEGRTLRVIVPCGPSGWYAPFTELVNARRVSLAHVEVFHMDECLDWQGQPLPRAPPLQLPRLHGAALLRADRDRAAGAGGEPALARAGRGWRRSPRARSSGRRTSSTAAGARTGTSPTTRPAGTRSARVTVEELRQSTARVQDNNLDTIVALAQRTFGGAYQFVPPMSVTLGLREILAARRIRVFSDTGRLEADRPARRPSSAR